MEHHEDQSESPSETKEESIGLQKPKRWEKKENILYYINALQQTSGPNAIEISFHNKRRHYKRFDKDFAERLLRELEPEVFNDETLAQRMIDEYAKRTKSKFNTLKRSFFKSKKQPIEDFPIYIYT